MDFSLRRAPSCTETRPPSETDDVVVDGAVGEDEARAPRQVEELLPAQHPSGMLHEGREQLELGERHVDGLAGAPDLASRKVQLHVAELKHRGRGPVRVYLRSPQERLDARAQFLGSERDP